MKKEKVESLQQAYTVLDQIDESLIELIAARQFYVNQAVRFKPTEPLRVEQVIEQVRHHATSQGVDADMVERIYRDMIQHFIQRELKEIRP